MENVDSLALEHLRHIRAKVDQTSDDVKDLKSRMTTLENTVISARRDILNSDATDAHLQVSLDSLAERIEKIGSRLEIA